MPIVPIEKLQKASLDYLIIGGGTCGLTLAARLSEDKHVNVGVIEAGGYHPEAELINIPGYMGRTVGHPTYDWSLLSVPQKHAAGLRIGQPRGKGLGGSSAINFLGMFRPAKEEIDALEILGNPGWNWESMLKYFKKSETIAPVEYSPSDAARFAASPDPQFHGSSGPIKKSFSSFLMEVHGLFFDTMEALGVPRNTDMCNGSNVGTMTPMHSIDIKTGKRSYAASEYYAPNAGRPNLMVVTDAQVTKVCLQPSQNGSQRAIGVEVVSNDKKYMVQGVKREIILSAGAFQTPQLLELSGIGNEAILNAHGIKPIIHLPGVGENLQDHVCVRSVVEIDPAYETLDMLKDPEVMQKQLELYKENKGYLANASWSGCAFLSSQHLGIRNDEHIWQKFSDHLSPEKINVVDSSLRTGLQKQYEIQKSWANDDYLSQAEIIIHLKHHPLQFPPPEPGKRYTTLANVGMHPLSRGTVHICSSDPLVAPAIDPNYFSNEADMDILVEALSFTNKILKTPPFKDIVRSYVAPSEEVLKPDAGLRDRMREFIKQGCNPVFHPVGTAAMLPLADGGVVDSTLKVYGTDNLRVVDLSILPLEVACHTQAIAYAIGEKAADILKYV